jgi:hypothetical protein
MRTIAALLALILSTAGAFAVDSILSATASGTVTVEETVATGVTRLRTTPLNNARLFSEYAVSPKDYGLVIGISQNFTGLVFAPRIVPGLPEIYVFAFANGDYKVRVSDSVRGVSRVYIDLINGPGGNVFSNFNAAMSGTLKYAGPGITGPVTKVTFRINGRGTAANGGTPGTSALLNFKITTGRKFIQGH